MDCRWPLRNRTRGVADLHSETGAAATRASECRIRATVAHGDPENF